MLWRPDETTVGDEIVTEMRNLLTMHSAYELRTLCAALALPTSGSRAERIDRLFRERLFQMSDYREVMMIMWEGTLVEYLRSKGFRMEKGGEDPRKIALQLWTSKRKPVEGSYADSFVPRTVAPARQRAVGPSGADARQLSGLGRCQQRTNSVDALELLESLHEYEATMKAQEKVVRASGGADERAMLRYLEAHTQVRRVEREGRAALRMQLETVLSQVGHIIARAEHQRGRLAEIEAERAATAARFEARDLRERAQCGVYFNAAAISAAQRARDAVNIPARKEELVAARRLLESQLARAQKAQVQCARNAKQAVDDVDTTKAAIVRERELLKTMDAKFEELEARACLYGAADEAILDALGDGIAAPASVALRAARGRLEQAQAILVPMLRASNPDPKGVKPNAVINGAAQVLVGLGLMDEDGVREKQAQVSMWREELNQRRVAALLEAKANKGKKGKKGKGKGKKGKGKKGPARRKKKGKGKAKGKGKGKKKK